MGIIGFQKNISKKIKQVQFSQNYSKIKEIYQIIVFIFIQKGFFINYIIDIQNYIIDIQNYTTIECGGDDNPGDDQSKKRKIDENPGDEKPRKRKNIYNLGITTNIDDIEPVKKDEEGKSKAHTSQFIDMHIDQEKDKEIICGSPTTTLSEKDYYQDGIITRKEIISEIITQTNVEISEVTVCHNEGITRLKEEQEESSKQTNNKKQKEEQEINYRMEVIKEEIDHERTMRSQKKRQDEENESIKEVERQDEEIEKELAKRQIRK